MKTIAIGLAFVLGLFGLGIFFSYFQTGVKVATAPARVVEQTMDAADMILAYEKFRDEFTAYQGKLQQIKSDEKAKPINNEDAMQLTTELRGERQACRDLAATYNADALKINKNIFKNPPIGGGLILPAELDMEACNQ